MIYVTLRFDDGTITQYTNAFKYMKEFNMPGSIYVIGSKLSEAGGTSYIKIDQLLEMQEAGWEIGYHSWSHNKEWIDDPNTYHNETDKRALETSGIRITTFALPHSLYNKEVLNHLVYNDGKDRNYKGIIGIPSKMGNSMNIMPNNNLFRSYTITRSTKLNTIITRIVEAIEANEYLILLFHRIERTSDVDGVGQWSMPLKRFNKVIKALDSFQKQGLVQVLTLDNAIDFISSG